MAKTPSPNFVELAKSAKAVPATLLAAWGTYGGQYAAPFDPLFRPWASGVCLAAMVIGGALLTYSAIRATLR
jgi:hypothetical protein